MLEDKTFDQSVKMSYDFAHFQPARIVIRDEPISDENTVSLG